MRKFTTRIYTKANYLLNCGRMALSNQRGDFYISDAVKIIIAVVLGALLLSALTLMLITIIAPPDIFDEIHIHLAAAVTTKRAIHIYTVCLSASDS